MAYVKTRWKPKRYSDELFPNSDQYWLKINKVYNLYGYKLKYWGYNDVTYMHIYEIVVSNKNATELVNRYVEVWSLTDLRIEDWKLTLRTALSKQGILMGAETRYKKNLNNWSGLKKPTKAKRTSVKKPGRPFDKRHKRRTNPEILNRQARPNQATKKSIVVED